ncbi:hypothetical protein [Maribacter sp. ACAM166]|uniref:hypothetical protein n=1 Tax=Maribacter sp. ACAM166 TaxID=2508996 RepID=UPI0010FCDC2A|nr:hypothetical protein [Maribacter sp. ACAM166]TLP80127.1 hypothetical protein ES765_09095 [Maribacter sp. ACAM166]
MLLFLQIGIYAQEKMVIDQKGTLVNVRNTIVTTAATTPNAPLQNDIWFDTTAEVTKIYDGSTWLTINLNALANKEDSANKSTDTNLADDTNTKFPTELAVKTYVDAQLVTSDDDDITGVSFDGTNLKVDEGETSFSADLSGLRDSDWFQANSNNTATNINQDIYTMGNVGIGTNNPQRGLHIAGENSVLRLSRSSDTAAMIFDRYSGSMSNTLKSFQFGMNASGAGVGEFFFADYNENISGGSYTRMMTFTDGNEVIRFNQYGTGNFSSTGFSYILGVDTDGDIVEVDLSSYDSDASDDFSGDYNDLINQPTNSTVSGTEGSIFFADTDGTPTENNAALFWNANDTRLGIGTNNPTQKLEVNGTIKALKIFNGDGTQGSPSYAFNDDTDTGIFNAATNEIGISTGGQEAMRIDAEQRVGIGTKTPNSTLHTNGSFSTAIIKTTGDLTLNETHHTVILGEDHDITLPSASQCKGRIYIIKNPTKHDSSISDFLNNKGDVDNTLKKEGLLWLQSDGSDWQELTTTK